MNILGLGGAVGHDVYLNSPLIRRGELMACSPTYAPNMLYGTDLQFLVMGNVLVKKPDAPTY
jgi:carbamoyltransferase